MLPQPEKQQELLQVNITLFSENIYGRGRLLEQRRILGLHGPSISPSKRKFMAGPIINPALSLLIKHVIIGQSGKAPNCSALLTSLFARR